MSRRGHAKPLTCCDHDCAAANGCMLGGTRCAGCGLWYCDDEMNVIDGRCYCDECAEERENESEENND